MMATRTFRCAESRLRDCQEAAAMSTTPPVITDAAPSFHDEQARRRRTYVILMVVHIVGFAASYPLYLWTPVAGVVAVVLTGVLPWVAVLLANDAGRRGGSRQGVGRRKRTLPSSTAGATPGVVVVPRHDAP
jgi:hypothetical protein